jgi:hypothetical protein
MRSERRQHIARIKVARSHHWGGGLRLDPRRLGKCVATAAPCSCAMCGNPRRIHKERTVQERSAEGLLKAEKT